MDKGHYWHGCLAAGRRNTARLCTLCQSARGAAGPHPREAGLNMGSEWMGRDICCPGRTWRSRGQEMKQSKCSVLTGDRTAKRVNKLSFQIQREGVQDDTRSGRDVRLGSPGIDPARVRTLYGHVAQPLSLSWGRSDVFFPSPGGLWKNAWRLTFDICLVIDVGACCLAWYSPPIYLSTTTSDLRRRLRPQRTHTPFSPRPFVLSFAPMKVSLAAVLLAAAPAFAHDFNPVHNARHLHLVERQNPSPSTSPTPAGTSTTSTSTSTTPPSVGTSTSPGVSTGTPAPSQGSSTTTRPPSTITGGPGAIPIDSLTSGMSSGTPILPSTTYPAGSRPTWSGAPPLPSPCTPYPHFSRPRRSHPFFQSFTRRKTGPHKMSLSTRVC